MFDEFELMIGFCSLGRFIKADCGVVQFAGLLVAFIGVVVVYFLPRATPALRDLIGMPGV